MRYVRTAQVSSAGAWRASGARAPLLALARDRADVMSTLRDLTAMFVAPESSHNLTI